jgi:hypothetical protein
VTERRREKRIIVLVNDGWDAGGRDLSGERDIRIKDIDRFKSGKAQYLEAVLWKFYDLGIDPGINVHIGHIDYSEMILLNNTVEVDTVAAAYIETFNRTLACD